MSGIGNALGQVGQSTGLSNITGGISDLFTGGSQAATPAQVAGAVMPSDTLFGQPMPPKAAIEPTPSPTFMQAFAQGFMGAVPGAGADVPIGAGPELAGGLGQLMHTINQLRNPEGLVKQGIVNLAGKPNVPSVDVAPGYQQSSAPQSGLLHRIIQGLTYGIIDSPKMSGT